VEVFERATGRPVRCCPLGVDAEVFRFATHPRRPGGRFRFLWVGAPNARKGWPCVAEAWEALTRERSRGGIDFDCELYVKTTVTEKLADLGGGVTWDSRRLPERELARLYAEAHCFLFPTMGEGFGLTLAEAMAAGLPCIYTPWTAAEELMAPGCGWPLRYGTERIALDGGLGEALFARADSQDLAAKMLRVLRSPREAALRGRRAARRVREQFTWQRTGSALLGILEEISCLQAAS
jgi:hypothetical protein